MILCKHKNDSEILDIKTDDYMKRDIYRVSGGPQNDGIDYYVYQFDESVGESIEERLKTLEGWSTEKLSDDILANLEYKRLLTIYYITGITWKKGIALLTIRNFIIIVIPTIISSIFSNKIVTYLRTLYTYNEKNVYITLFIYIGIFILTTAVTVIGLRDKKPIEVLREVD